MNVYEMDSCCSALVISELWGPVTPEEIKESLAECISGYTIYPTKKLGEYPTFLVATTHSSEQKQAEASLKTLGFRETRFFGRHQPRTGKRNKYMKFWTKATLPRGVLTRARKLVEEAYT
jgi:hypothetical protein